MRIVKSILMSAVGALPPWDDEEPLTGTNTVMSLDGVHTVASYPDNYKLLEFPGGQNVRAAVLAVMNELVDRLIGSDEEHAMALSLIASVWAQNTAQFFTIRLHLSEENRFCV